MDAVSETQTSRVLATMINETTKINIINTSIFNKSFYNLGVFNGSKILIKNKNLPNKIIDG